MIRVDRQLFCSSSSSFSLSSSLLSSWSYLKENLGFVQDDWPRPNWILTEETTLEGESSEVGREEDLCRGMARLPRPLPWVRSISLGRCSPLSPSLFSWYWLARFRALSTGQDGVRGLSSASTLPAGVSVWFCVCCDSCSDALWDISVSGRGSVRPPFSAGASTEVSSCCFLGS